MQNKLLMPSGKHCDMDRKYTVQITEEAQSDMAEIYRYIVQTLKSPENALGQYNRIADGILSLERFPERCSVVGFEPERTAGLCRLLVDNYSVFYVCRETRVTVIAVLYSSADIEQRLKEHHQ